MRQVNKSERELLFVWHPPPRARHSFQLRTAPLAMGALLPLGTNRGRKSMPRQRKSRRVRFNELAKRNVGAELCGRL